MLEGGNGWGKPVNADGAGCPTCPPPPTGDNQPWTYRAVAKKFRCIFKSGHSKWGNMNLGFEEIRWKMRKWGKHHFEEAVQTREEIMENKNLGVEIRT